MDLDLVSTRRPPLLGSRQHEKTAILGGLEIDALLKQQGFGSRILEKQLPEDMCGVFTRENLEDQVDGFHVRCKGDTGTVRFIPVRLEGILDFFVTVREGELCKK